VVPAAKVIRNRNDWMVVGSSKRGARRKESGARPFERRGREEKPERVVRAAPKRVKKKRKNYVRKRHMRKKITEEEVETDFYF